MRNLLYFKALKLFEQENFNIYQKKHFFNIRENYYIMCKKWFYNPSGKIVKYIYGFSFLNNYNKIK